MAEVVKGIRTEIGALKGVVREAENARTTGVLTIPVIAYREVLNPEGGITVMIGGGRDENDPG